MSIRLVVNFAVLCAMAITCRAEGDIEWRYGATQGKVMLNANPLPLAQRMAFYLARGFSAAAIRPYVQACGFSFRMRNLGAGSIRTSLADWRGVAPDGRRVRLRLPAEWDADWVRAGVLAPARIAFRWAQFQAENTFDAGDWIMGMATLEAPLPGRFRLVARYHDEQGDHEIVLDELACDDG